MATTVTDEIKAAYADLAAACRGWSVAGTRCHFVARAIMRDDLDYARQLLLEMRDGAETPAIALAADKLARLLTPAPAKPAQE